MNNIILTSSFKDVAQELAQREVLPQPPQRVCFITTASTCYKDHPWLEDDRRALVNLGYDVDDFDVAEKSPREVTNALTPATILFVAGGNISYLTEHIHRSGADQIIRDLVTSGRIYIGSSAGSILAGPSIEPYLKEDASELSNNFIVHDPTGLTLVPYIILPHYAGYSEYHAKLTELFGHRWPFVHVTDQEYKIEHL